MPEKGYITSIGLEVHIQLATVSKLFCADSTVFGAIQNSQVSEVSLAYPGALPVLNERAVELALRLALSMGSVIADIMLFDRKNYFYPDLPKGYQITQDRAPLGRGGYVPIELDGESLRVNINRLHLEEDAGRSVHDLSDSHSLIDYNRAGIPLVEVVTEPVFSHGRQVAEFLSTMRRLVRYLEVSDGNMEEGSLRCDVNISQREEGHEEYGKKVEVKNLNSIRFVQKAIEFEQERQAGLLDQGKEILEETRLFDPESGTTRGMRKKETLTDYRYFPDPDLPSFRISTEMVEKVKQVMPLTPWEMRRRLISEYGLPAYDAGVLYEERAIAEYFIQLSELSGSPKSCSNWIMGPVKGYLNESGIPITEFPLHIDRMAELIRLVETGEVSHSPASRILFPAMLERRDSSPSELARELGLTGTGYPENELSDMLNVLWDEYPDEARMLSEGRTKLLGMFMGEMMKRTEGKADPVLIRKLIMKKIG